jgi:hypothetical protein
MPLGDNKSSLGYSRDCKLFVIQSLIFIGYCTEIWIQNISSDIGDNIVLHSVRSRQQWDSTMDAGWRVGFDSAVGFFPQLNPGIVAFETDSITHEFRLEYTSEGISSINGVF